jgi:UMF1 family MFS transporter
MHQDLTTRVDRPRAAAWVLYDTGNSIYSAAVTFLLAPWVTGALGASRSAFGATQTASMILAGLAVPLLGAVCDRSRWGRRLLITSTLATVAAMIALAETSSAARALLVFGLANLTYQAALVFYDALLPSVTPLRRAGLISGLGVGLGFAGTVATAAGLARFGAGLGTAQALRIGAAAFLVLALPCLLMVRDRRDLPRHPPPLRTLTGEAARSLLSTLRGLPKDRALALFLLGNFFLTDVIWTAALFFADYTSTVFEAPYLEDGLDLFGLEFRHQPGTTPSLLPFVGTLGAALNVAALLFGVLCGWLADRIRALRVMQLSAVALGLALLGGAWWGGRDAELFAVSMVTGGALGMAGIKTAGRKVLLELAPRERLAEYVGLYGITAKLSVVGALVYGLIADLADARSALLAQCVQLTLGLTCLLLIRTGGRTAPGPAG